MNRLAAGLALIVLACFKSTGSADSIVVFNEIMYHPASNEPSLEWLELYNQNSVDVDMSGWQLSDGVHYTFPNGTVIRAGGSLVVSISPDTLLGLTSAKNIVGPFTGRLSNSGEKLDLRDNNNRLMDSVTYGVDGDWPVGADGAGPALAKKSPALASNRPESWTVSHQIGGTPGADNFSSAPLTGATTTIVTLTNGWRYNDAGVDLGMAWRAPVYDDSGWSSGPALHYAGNASLPAVANTPLTPGRSTYYFRTTFPFGGDPTLKLLSFRSIIDDGAVFYLNGNEVGRFNMPGGAVNYSTLAAGSVPTAALNGPFSIAASNLVVGQNVLAVELHQNSATTNSGLRVLNSAAYNVGWDGADGGFSTGASPDFAPPNDALKSAGVDVFATSNTNLATNLNDGLYGNGSSWSPSGTDLSPGIILRFNQTIPISSIAWSRDNGNTNDAACGGTCTDRSLGNYTFQYTLAANPAVVVANSINPSNGWATIATVQHFSAQPGFTPHLRHRFAFASTNGNTLLATGIRIRPSVSNTIDEIEINSPSGATFDAAFGTQLDSTDILPPPPKLAFNEIGNASGTAFWLEIINYGETPVDLAGVQIVRTTSGSITYTFPAQTLAPGEIVYRTEIQLGFSAFGGNKVFLYTPGKTILLDAATVVAKTRGRNPDGTGGWMFPSVATPGASNVFNLRDDIVFNEIMYHDRPFDPVPAVTSNLTLVEITGGWRYNDSGTDLGSSWRAPAYDDSAWGSGLGVFSFNAALLPAPTNTLLAPDRSTYYFRTSFPFSGTGSNLTVNLRSIIDDGAVFYLNGNEIYRQNLPAGPVSYATSALTAVGNATYSVPVVISASNLVQGVNVLAVEVHQASASATSSGVVLSGGGLTLVEEGPFGGSPPMNLALQPGSTPFVIDSLAGYPIHDYLHLNDGVYGNANSWIGNTGNPGYAGLSFGGLNTISGIAFGRDNLGTFSDRTLGLYTLQYTRVATPGIGTTVTGNADTGWANIGTLNYQSAGSGLFANPSRRHRYTFDAVQATGIRLLVPGTGLGGGTDIDELEVNPPDTGGDIAFAAELVLVTTLSPAFPFTKSDEEWLEFCNRGTNDLDLAGWQIDGAVKYLFPANSIIQPDGYLVVATNAAALRAKWPEAADNILGDFSGRMSAGEKVILRDPAGNIVNSVQIFPVGWSDGGGSSLELIDPRGDNSELSAWLDSDETGRSQWQTVSYRMVASQAFGSSFWNEFRLGMLDSGEALVDDVSVVRNPDGASQQLIQNGDFEMASGNAHWRMLGDHGRSQIITDPDNPGNHVLKVVATSPARTSHNHIESSFVNNTPVVDGQEYEVHYRARWLGGSPQIGTSAYFAKAARATSISVPARHGTPGAVNSRRVANAGPSLRDLKHSPVVPQPADAVTISVRASDPDGVAVLTVSYRVNPAATFSDTAMTLQPDGTWTAILPAQAGGKVVQFYVTAQDQLGATSFAPVAGPNSRALYQVADGQGTTLPAHELRLIQLDADRDFLLNATNVMSQQHIGATIIYDRSEVFYDGGVRLHGSAAGRARDGEDYISYDLAFPPDHLFRGVHESVGIDRSGRAPAARHQDEIYILHMFHRAAVQCHYSDLCYFIAPKANQTGPAILQLAVYGGMFVDEQFAGGGSIFNYDGTYEPSITVNGNYESVKLPVPLQGQLWTDFVDLGNDKEQYRSPFDMRFGERVDDFTGIIRLCQTMALPQAQFDAQIPSALAVDESLRIMALTVLCGIGDIYVSPGGLPHNLRLFTPLDGGPTHFLPWDMDFVFTASTSSTIYPNPTSNLNKFSINPVTRRAYLYHINDLCQNVFNSAYMTPWLAHYGSVVGQNYTGGASYIQSRASYALTQLPGQQAFAITNNHGNPFLTNTPTVTLAGSGWLEVSQIRLAGTTNPLALTWTSVTNWQVTVPLILGTNLVNLIAYDRGTNAIGSSSIVVTTSAIGGGLDTDGDGMPDEWEIANGLNPLVNDANADTDKDGITNLQEFLAGTDPNDAQSFLKIQAANDAGVVRLSFVAVAGRAYSLLARSDLNTGSWTKFSDVVPQITNKVVQIAIPQPLGAAQTFYRLMTPP